MNSCSARRLPLGEEKELDGSSGFAAAARPEARKRAPKTGHRFPQLRAVPVLGALQHDTDIADTAIAVMHASKTKAILPGPPANQLAHACVRNGAEWLA
jgi:hypothetical protein